MRLKHLVAVGIALFCVMLVVHGDEITSGESSSIAIVLLIDNSKSVNDLDKDGERFAKAMSFIGFLNNSTHVVGLVSTLGNNRGGLEYICKDPTRNFDLINNTLLDIKSESERFPRMQQHKITNINEFLIRATILLENNKFNCMNNITIFFSDGVPNDVTPNGGYNNSTLINIEEKTWIYTIGIGNDSTGTGILKEISYSTHSKFYHWVDIDPVTILRDINSRINSNIAFIDVNKTTHPSSGSNGTVVNFTINVTNTGNATFDPVIVTDTLPEGLDYFNSSDKCELSGDNVTWNLGQLVESESRLVYLEAKINSSKSGNLTNNVTVTGVTLSDDNVTANYSDNVTVINASISVNKTAHPSSGSNGTVVNFTINVTNTGNATLNPVMVTDSLPEGLDYVNSTGLLDTSSNNVTWNLGSLSKPEHKLVYLEARINRSESGVLTNLVLVEGKPKSGYNVTDDNSTIVTVVDASISVNKTSNISSGSNGTVVNFTINVTNTGNATLNPVILTDTLPEGLDYVSSTDEGNNSSNNVTWNLGSLNKSDHKLVYLEAKINRSESGVLTNVVRVEGKPELGYNATDNDSEKVLVDIASISVNKTSNPGSGSNGTVVNFTINVTNTGNATLNPVMVTDSLPEGLDYVGSTGLLDTSSNNVTWNLGSLSKSEHKLVYLEARINRSESGVLTNVVRVEGKPESGYNATDNDSEEILVDIASISANKTSNISSGSYGTLVNFMINVTNTGNATLNPVILTDTLPEGLDYVSSTDEGNNSSNNVTWNLRSLNKSDHKLVYLEAKINRSESSVLTNLVLVEGKPESGYNVTHDSSTTVTVVDASISVNKTSKISSGSYGTLVNFTINVTNTGNATFDPVIVTDTLPEGLDYFNSSDKCELSGDKVTWNLSQLVESGFRVIYFEARINSSKSGNLTNNVTVTGVTLSDDNVTANDSDNVTVINASISVNKTAHPSSGSNGTLVNFTINVTNTGNATFDPVMVTDSLPEGLDYVNSTGLLDTSSNNVTWNLGKLKESEFRAVYLEARINRSESGVLTNLVLVEGKPESGYNATDNDSEDLLMNYTSVVFALDTSGSMRKYYLLAPNEGAEIVSGWAGFGNATVSIVSWDHNSEIIFGPAPLVGSEGRLAEVLESLSEICIETDLTIYDQGLKGALAALRDEATFSDGSSKIIIFLAGYSEFKPGARLDDYISEADRSGIRIFTIGMGINESLNASEKQHHNLTKISHGTRGEFYSITAFSPQELKLVMEEIAHKL